MPFALPPIPPATASGYSRKPAMRLTAEQQNLYLAHLAQCGLVGESAGAAGVSRQSIVKLRDRDPDFKAAEEDAVAAFHEKLEREVIRRGFEGYAEGVYYQGSLVDTQTRFDSGLAALFLKRSIPEYRDKVSIDANVRAGVMLAPGTMDTASWLAAFGGNTDDSETRKDGQQ